MLACDFYIVGKNPRQRVQDCYVLLVRKIRHPMKRQWLRFRPHSAQRTNKLCHSMLRGAKFVSGCCECRLLY
jgi:hypothetical protein